MDRRFRRPNIELSSAADHDPGRSSLRVGARSKNRYPRRLLQRFVTFIPLSDLRSPPANAPAHPRGFLLLLAHACCRYRHNSCQPSYISSSSPSAAQLTIHTGRPLPTQAAILLTRLLTQARAQIAAQATCAVKPWPHRYPRLLLQDVVECACDSFSGRSPSPPACSGPIALSKMITRLGLVLLRAFSGQLEFRLKVTPS